MIENVSNIGLFREFSSFDQMILVIKVPVQNKFQTIIIFTISFRLISQKEGRLETSDSCSLDIVDMPNLGLLICRQLIFSNYCKLMDVTAETAGLITAFLCLS